MQKRPDMLYAYGSIDRNKFYAVYSFITNEANNKTHALLLRIILLFIAKYINNFKVVIEPKL